MPRPLRSHRLNFWLPLPEASVQFEVERHELARRVRDGTLQPRLRRINGRALWVVSSEALARDYRRRGPSKQRADSDRLARIERTVDALKPLPAALEALRRDTERNSSIRRELVAHVRNAVVAVVLCGVFLGAFRAEPVAWIARTYRVVAEGVEDGLRLGFVPNERGGSPRVEPGADPIAVEILRQEYGALSSPLSPSDARIQPALEIVARILPTTAKAIRELIARGVLVELGTTHASRTAASGVTVLHAGEPSVIGVQLENRAPLAIALTLMHEYQHVRIAESAPSPIAHFESFYHDLTTIRNLAGMYADGRVELAEMWSRTIHTMERIAREHDFDFSAEFARLERGSAAPFGISTNGDSRYQLP